MRDSSSADVQKLARDRVKQKDHDDHVGSMESWMILDASEGLNTKEVRCMAVMMLLIRDVHFIIIIIADFPLLICIHIYISLYIYICMMVNLLDGLRSAKFRNQRYWKMERGRERERGREI